MSDYWAKIYIEIIDDPKMATMPDRLWRRTIELFLLAKRHNQAGYLPSTKQIAWELRMSTAEVEQDLREIAAVGIIREEAEGWFVVAFAKRQAASTSTERSQQYRKKTQAEQYYGDDATELQRNVVQSTETETKTETKALTLAPSAPVSQIGVKVEKVPGLTPDQRVFLDQVMAIIAPRQFKTIRVIDKLLELREKYPDSDLLEAMEWAAGKEMLPGEAVLAVVKAMPRWRERDKVPVTVRGNGNGHKAVVLNPLAAALAKRKAEINGN